MMRGKSLKKLGTERCRTMSITYCVGTVRLANGKEINDHQERSVRWAEHEVEKTVEHRELKLMSDVDVKYVKGKDICTRNRKTQQVRRTEKQLVEQRTMWGITQGSFCNQNYSMRKRLRRLTTEASGLSEFFFSLSEKRCIQYGVAALHCDRRIHLRGSDSYHYRT